MKKSLLITVLSAAVMIVGCKPEASSVSQSVAADAPRAAAALPGNLRLSAAPADAKEVVASKTGLKDGDRVVIQGVVAGSKDPIAANRAILTLLDRSINTCDKNPADGCTTPWDVCCEPAETRASHSVTVQVVDPEGKPLKTSLTGLEGLKPLAKLTVQGVAKVASDGNIIVNADGVFVE